MANFSLSMPNFRTGGASGAVGGAAGNTDVAGLHSSAVAAMPRVDQLMADGLRNRSAERQAVTGAEAAVAATGLQSMAAVEAAKIQAKAQMKAARAQASASKSGAMMSGIGSIIGAGIGLLSDESTKDTITAIDDALTTLRSLRPVSFYYKEEYSTSPERKHHGFIAQEFGKVLPDATYYDESVGKQCIDTGDLIGLLVRGIQQLETRVLRLEAERALTGVK